jgi:hypothetical protein
MGEGGNRFPNEISKSPRPESHRTGQVRGLRVAWARNARQSPSLSRFLGIAANSARREATSMPDRDPVGAREPET